MPLLKCNYKPSPLFRWGHFSTIYQAVFRSVHGLVQKRERLELADGDFLDLDWSHTSPPSSKVALLLHGLEGDAQRHYIMGSAKALNKNAFDACAVNLRGCSGEPNRLYRSYHSGVTEDLNAVVQHVLETRGYNQIFLMGFSLGGNVVLKYLGENDRVPKAIRAAMGISVPCNLDQTCEELLKPKNRLYAHRFKKHLLNKLRIKQQWFPERISTSEIKSVVTLKDFDDIYTAPAHGFKNAIDYYEKCSCKPFLPHIKVPSLILNAKNDSFLGADCYPYKEAEKNPNLYLEVPDYGGHVGFVGGKNVTYAEQRAVAFFTERY